MLRAFGHPVVTYCDMLGVVRSNLKMVKFFMQHLWMLHDVAVVLHPCMHTESLLMLRPTTLLYAALTCCDRLAEASH